MNYFLFYLHSNPLPDLFQLVTSQREKVPKEAAKCFVSVGIKDPKVQEDRFNQAEPWKEKDCFLMCLFKGDDFVTEDGNINSEHIHLIFQQLNPNVKSKEVGNLITNCQAAANKIPDKCEKAVEGVRCVLKPMQEALSKSQG